MKCPNCSYEDGWSAEQLKSVSGEHGIFFTLSNNIEAERSEFRFGRHFREEERTVYFCPKCGISFIEVD